MKLLQGDCLELMKDIPDGSVDMILQDPPYNTTACKWEWDIMTKIDEFWAEWKRIIKPNGAIVMTASQPFTTRLISSNYKDFKYCLIWNKKFGIPAHAKIRPMKTHEDICIFGIGRVNYYPQMIKRDKPIKSGGNKCESITSPLTRIEGFKKTYTEKFPVSILDYKRDLGRTTHPTQKPIALMEYLIKTYTNEGDTVFDGFMGSGTTGVACLNTNRHFIGMELDETYFNIARQRIESHRLDIHPKSA